MIYDAINYLHNLIMKKNIITIIKIFIIYILLLVIFYIFHNDKIRLLFLSLLFILCIFLFNINNKLAILYIFIALCSIITEAILITFFSNTWLYKNPNIINIPYWLFPLWGIAIIFINELSNNT